MSHNLIKCSNCYNPTYTLNTFVDYPNLTCPVCRKEIVLERKVSKGIDVQCGCGRHLISPTDDDVIVYRERCWKLKCVFLKVDKRLPRILRRMEAMEKEIARHRKMRLKFIRMKKYMRQLPCDYCGEQVGNRFKQVNDGILCNICNRDYSANYQ